ncbi:MAG: hypothetical protein CMJ20_07105 [Phycisphaeraceae bacterium]|nr:hypothetical protein [Phycisphaeraceae bacterium]|tara:strand:+ start:665 stop:976 length:312 start_codon:yes stop_codon:yes gene_type:complete
MLYALMAKSTDPDDARQLVSSISERVGIKHKHDNNYLKLSHTIDSIILEAALFSTRKVVEDAERFATDWGITIQMEISSSPMPSKMPFPIGSNLGADLANEAK